MTKEEEQTMVRRLHKIIREEAEREEVPSCRDEEVKGCFIVWNIDGDKGSMTILGDVKSSYVIQALEIVMHATFIPIGAILYG